MKTMTPAAANKWIKALEDEKEYYISVESSASVYTLSEGEEEEKPEYDYVTISCKIRAIDEKIQRIRHAINVFNITTVLPELNITLDQALIRMAQLNKRKATLDIMRRRLPKERMNSFHNRNKSVVEYLYTNYDVELVKDDYVKLSDEITQLQLALDICNQTMTFEMEEE